jgi:hypothetical protein
LFIFRLKSMAFRVDNTVMTLLIFLFAWMLLAFAAAVPVGKLCAAKTPR